MRKLGSRCSWFLTISPYPWGKRWNRAREHSSPANEAPHSVCICSSLSGLQNLAQGTVGSGSGLGLVPVAFIRKSKFLRKAVDDLRPPGPGISYLILPLPLNFHYQSQMSLASVMVTCAFSWIMGKEKSLLSWIQLCVMLCMCMCFVTQSSY